MNAKNRFILINLLAFEFILLNLVLLFCLFYSMPNFSFSDSGFVLKAFSLVVAYNLSWFFIVLYIRDKYFYFNPDYAYRKSLLTSSFFFVGIITTLTILFRIEYFDFFVLVVPIFIFCFLNMLGHRYLLEYLKKRGGHLMSNTLLIASGYESSKLKAFTKDMVEYGYYIKGYLDNKLDKQRTSAAFQVTGHISHLSRVLGEHSFDEILIDMSGLDKKDVKKSVTVADSFGVRVKLVPENPVLMAKTYKALAIGDLAVYKLRRSPLDTFSKTILKRAFDFCFALSVIVLLSPLFLLISIFIVLDSKGPVFYKPYRKGEAGKTFQCFKFRTMRECEDPLNGTRSTVKNDPRITRVGKILRKSDLDELPQFFNVLKGEMSVIGPRPHRINLQNDFRKSIGHYMVRSYVKPGITGWAQVNGWRGPTVTEEQKSERVHHDLWYIENWSFWLDMKIIFLTVFGGHHKKAF